MDTAYLRRISPLTAVTAIVLALLAPAAATASAIPRVEHYVASDSFSYDDCGFLVVGTYEESGMYRATPQGLELTNVEWRIVETNPATGEWFERTSNTVSLDTTAKLVEGTIYRFTTIQAGRSFSLFDMNGSRLFHDRGRLAITYLLDTQGDADPSNDDVIDGTFELVASNGKHPADAYFSEHDWCEFVTALIG